MSTWAQEKAERAALLKKWQRRPEEVEESAVAAALLEIFSDIEFARRSRPASKELIARLVAAPSSFRAMFLAELMRTAPEPDPKEAWANAFSALLELDAFEKLRLDERLARGRQIVKNPRVLQAIQTAVVGTRGQGPLELLAADGSTASVDALLPSALAAQKDGGYRLDFARHERNRSNPFSPSEVEGRTSTLSVAGRGRS